MNDWGRKRMSVCNKKALIPQRNSVDFNTIELIGFEVKNKMKRDSG